MNSAPSSHNDFWGVGFSFGKKRFEPAVYITLVTMMMNPFTSYGAVIQKQEVKIILNFEKLPEEIVNQQFLVGAEESDIDLPDQLNVMIRGH